MISRRTDAELDKMHQANAIVVNTLFKLKAAVEPGMSTADLDRIAAEELKREGAKPAFKGYRGFPAVLCASINDEVVHGIPSQDRKVENGDIISLDFGSIVDGFYGDNAMTIPVGDVEPKLVELLEVTEEAMNRGIGAMQVGNRISDISRAVQNYAEDKGFSVVRDFVGHGIGLKLHEEPPLPNYVQAGPDPRLFEGQCLAIEPMVNVGAHAVKTLSDGWTVVTMDGSYSAHFERSVAILESGPWILCEPRHVMLERTNIV